MVSISLQLDVEGAIIVSGVEPTMSPWSMLFSSGCSQSFITFTGLDYCAFRKLLHVFKQTLQTKFNFHNGMCVLFGVTSSTCLLFLRFGRHILVYVLTPHGGGDVFQRLKKLSISRLLISKYSILPNVLAFADGLET
ncbi:hypothetical protein Plhal304r1_c012g0047061 [Plasmopara halstedii]